MAYPILISGLASYDVQFQKYSSLASLDHCDFGVSLTGMCVSHKDHVIPLTAETEICFRVLNCSEGLHHQLKDENQMIKHYCEKIVEIIRI